MNNDFLDPINAEGMPQLADASLALDFLLRVKTGIRTCAFAPRPYLTTGHIRDVEHVSAGGNLMKAVTYQGIKNVEVKEVV